MPDNQTKDMIRCKADEIAVYQHDCYFHQPSVDHIVDFARTYIINVVGMHAGEKFEPLQWVKNKILAPVFGWKKPNGKRRINNFDCFVPKKNAKSTHAALIKLYMLLADEERGAQVFSAAGDVKQASIIYQVAYSMVKANPELDSLLRMRKSQRSMYYDETDSFYKVLTSDGTRNEGYDIHCVGIDELHTQKDRRLYDALRYGGASRQQPLLFTISTAGELDETSLWMERLQIASNYQADKSENINYLGIVYAIKDEEDWNSPEVWKRCNPGWGITINEDLFRQDYEAAKANSADESSFLRYHLNRATRAETAWLRRQYWISCLGEFTPEAPHKIYSDLGADIADSMDINALVETVEVMHPTKGECIKIIPNFWIPEDAGKVANKGNNDRYTKWANEGYLQIVPGAIVTPQFMAEKANKLIQSSLYKPREVGIDIHHGLQFATFLREMVAKEKHRPKVSLIQYNPRSMNEPTKYLEQLITTGKLIVEDNPVLNWMFTNVKVYMDSSGNRKLDKSSNNAGKIDGFAAICFSLYMNILRKAEQLAKQSAYNNSDSRIAGINRLWGISE